MEDFPGNSNAARSSDPDRIQKISELKAAPPDNVTEFKKSSEPEKIRKIAEGKEKKKPLGQKFKEMFIHDGGDFVDHLVDDVIKPMAKDMLLSIVIQAGDGIKRGFEDMIFGPDSNGRRRPTTSYSSRPSVNYQRMSSPTTVRPSESRFGSRRDQPYSSSRSNRIRHIALHTREEGDDVLEELDRMINRMGHCTVGDYYMALGLDNISSTDHEWGWTTLKDARVRHIDDDFYIDFPRPRSIDS